MVGHLGCVTLVVVCRLVDYVGHLGCVTLVALCVTVGV